MIDKVKMHIAKGGVKELIIITYRFILSRISPVFMRIMGHFHSDRKIVFSHFDGKAYGGNPRIICDELIRIKAPYRLVWITDKRFKGSLPDEVDWVPVNSMRQLWALSTAKIWIDDCRKSNRFRKNNKQYYIQTWHGGGPCLKKIEADAISTLPQTYILDAKNDSEMADLFISACAWRTKNYREAFWYDGEILNCGTPASDIYSKDITSIKKEIYSTFNVNPLKRIVLYAPTFRSDHDTDCYRMDYIQILNSLKSRFQDEWIIIVRLHPSIMELSDFIKYSDQIINGSLYPQFEDLLISADALITDYSGCMFEAYRLGKKVFIYAPDLHKYVETERDLYFDITELPADVSLSDTDLINNILQFDEDHYNKKVNQFLEDIGYYPFGNATETIVARIKKVIEGDYDAR